MRIIGFVLAALVLASCTQKKIGYINIQTVFNGFEYKKELEKEVSSIQNNRKYLLDSMQTQLKVMANKLKISKDDKDLMAQFQTAKEIFYEKKSVFEEEEANIIKQSDEKIIRQINSYMKDFGKENKYDIIYGATMSGNIMYADTTLDLSRQVISYINDKYKGTK